MSCIIRIKQAGPHTSAEPIAADKLLVGLPGSIADPSGNMLEGGDFDFRIDVSPGDTTGDGTTDSSDFASMLSHQYTQPGDASYDATHDIDGSCFINVIFLIRLRRRPGTSPPA